MIFDGNLWLETGSPVKQQGDKDGRVLEVRYPRKIQANEDCDRRRTKTLAKPDRAHVAKAETRTQAS